MGGLTAAHGLKLKLLLWPRGRGLGSCSTGTGPALAGLGLLCAQRSRPRATHRATVNSAAASLGQLGRWTFRHSTDPKCISRESTSKPDFVRREA